MNENSTEMLNIVSSVTKSGNIEIHMKESKYYYLPFDKSEVNFRDNKIRDRFVKSVEARVRNSPKYKQYIFYLKNTVGLDRCAVFGNIKSEEKKKTKIEMHHGPIFTMYDYANIVLEKRLHDLNSDINTFDIAREVLLLHKRKLVQTVMLCETAHLSMNNPKIAPFITQDQTFGNLCGFLEEYHEYLLSEHVSKLKRYFENYDKNVKDNTLNMFKPVFTKYNIIFSENKNGGIIK